MRPIEVVPVFLGLLAKESECLTDDEWNPFINRVYDRLDFGMKKYGKPLTTHNGRDSLMDAWEEACDGCQYLIQAYYEGKLNDMTLILHQLQLFIQIEEEIIERRAEANQTAT